MKTAVVLSLALSAAPLTTLAAGPDGANIQVTAPTAHEALAKSVNRAIDRRLTRNLRLMASSNSFEKGFVAIRFKADATGRANAVEVVRRSGSRRFDELAARSVRHMNFGALPTGMAANQAVVAHIIVSSDQQQIDRYRAEIASAVRPSSTLAAGDAVIVSLIAPG